MANMVSIRQFLKDTKLELFQQNLGKSACTMKTIKLIISGFHDLAMSK